MGINPDLGFFVGADPVLHSPTRFPITIEFNDAAVKKIVARGWHVWERDGGVDKDRPVEILVGGTADSLLHYLAFERAALGEDQGHRHLLADKFAPPPRSRVTPIQNTNLQVVFRGYDLSEREMLTGASGGQPASPPLQRLFP